MLLDFLVTLGFSMHLDDLEGAGGCDDGVGRGHGRDDVLDDALCQAVRDARDAVGGRSLLRAIQ